MASLYFVKATKAGWDVVFAGHWLGQSPRHAILIAKGEMRGNNAGIGPTDPDKYEWKAARSSASPSQALNK